MKMIWHHSIYIFQLSNLFYIQYYKDVIFVAPLVYKRPSYKDIVDHETRSRLENVATKLATNNLHNMFD
jgi:hypothetical protein